MHLPLLRVGQPYASLDRLAIVHIADPATGFESTMRSRS